MSALSRRNEETYGIPAILQIIHAKVSEGAGLQRTALCLPEKSYGHVILIVTLEKIDGAFKKSLQKKILNTEGHYAIFHLQYKTMLKPQNWARNVPYYKNILCMWTE